MKKLFYTIIAVSFFYSAKAQMVIEAPTLEAINAQMLSSQAMSQADTYQTALNTLNTAKNSLSTLDQIKEWNERVATVSNAIKDYKDIAEIVNLTRQTYASAQKTVEFINNNSIEGAEDLISFSDRTVSQISNSLTNMASIVTLLNSFVSSSMKMNDFERKTLIDKYKRDAMREAYNVVNMRKKYELVLAFNQF